MTNNGKLLAATALLPLCADMLEDYPFKQEMKMRVNTLIKQIRGLDAVMMQGADNSTVEQQIAIQRAFRQWIEINFTEEKE